MKFIIRLVSAVVFIVVFFIIFIGFRYREFAHFPDRTSEPLLGFNGHIEVVAQTDFPPGNIAVSKNGRIFFTFHPTSNPPANVVEWKDGHWLPYPGQAWQPGGGEALSYQEVLSLRVDAQNRLWVLDNGAHGVGQPRLLAFNLSTDKLVYEFSFADEIFPLGSHANDFQVRTQGDYLFISDASVIGKSPALVVLDIKNKRARRVLEDHVSVQPGAYEPVVDGRSMTLFGVFTINPGVDGIALDRQGENLYFASITSNYLYTAKVKDLVDPALEPGELGSKVRVLAKKTMTDGMTTDVMGNIYLSDPEHSAILRMTSEGGLTTLFKDKRIRWPDGYSFGPDGYLYFTCSALNHILGKSTAYRQTQAPFQVYRFKAEYEGVPGH